MKAPCYKCEDRSDICHSICEKYIAYDEFNKTKRAELGKQAQERGAHKRHMIATLKRMKRGKRG